jgi:hypothetical protein
MDEAKKREERPQIEKVGVGWKREFKNKKAGLKLSIRGELFVAYENTKKVKPTDVDYVICKFLDSPKKEEK